MNPTPDPAIAPNPVHFPRGIDPSTAVLAFVGHRRLASGSPSEVAAAIDQYWSKARDIEGSTVPMVFDDANGRQVDVDPGAGAPGITEQIGQQITPGGLSSGSKGAGSVLPGAPVPRPNAASVSAMGATAAATRGRPRLGVVAREITLLPRQWDWLNLQPGGASAALRRLVDEARKRLAPEDRRREAREAIWRFATAINGNAVGFEEAMRALFAGDAAGFAARITDWPPDVVAHLQRFTETAFEQIPAVSDPDR